MLGRAVLVAVIRDGATPEQYRVDIVITGRISILYR